MSKLGSLKRCVVAVILVLAIIVFTSCMVCCGEGTDYMEYAVTIIVLNKPNVTISLKETEIMVLTSDLDPNVKVIIGVFNLPTIIFVMPLKYVEKEQVVDNTKISIYEIKSTYKPKYSIKKIVENELKKLIKMGVIKGLNIEDIESIIDRVCLGTLVIYLDKSWTVKPIKSYYELITQMTSPLYLFIYGAEIEGKRVMVASSPTPTYTSTIPSTTLVETLTVTSTTTVVESTTTIPSPKTLKPSTVVGVEERSMRTGHWIPHTSYTPYVFPSPEEQIYKLLISGIVALALGFLVYLLLRKHLS